MSFDRHRTMDEVMRDEERAARAADAFDDDDMDYVHFCIGIRRGTTRLLKAIIRARCQ